MKGLNLVIKICFFICSSQIALYSQQDKFKINIAVGSQITELSEETGRWFFESGELKMEERRILPKNNNHIFMTLYIIFKSNEANTGFNLPEKEIVLNNADNEAFIPIRSSDFTIVNDVKHSLTIQSLGKDKVSVEKSYFISNRVENGLKLIFEIPKTKNINDFSLTLNKALVGVIRTLIK